ncbi:hypothetical protein L1987_63528 [Smallanthus sonchifolius]|uniref:Uncharacterized protein n=1 Tax=Smallanthus sonchifolius TaxID=185202 RepID=A0ACB9CDI3_9ASTR|nr:hypothetical protein L1987_63528 [Smallanthus sonchifolius]
MSHSPPDLECGGASTSDDNQCFSDGSCFCSTYGDDPEIGQVEVVKDCRICHLSLVGDSDGDDAIELGCCCKNDLAAAHKHCAETWFKIKGNKTCEICNSVVSNLVVPNEMPGAMMDVSLEATSVARSTTTRGQGQSQSRGRGCINGHRLLNFILACLVFAFVISWLFHFNIPS